MSRIEFAAFPRDGDQRIERRGSALSHARLKVFGASRAFEDRIFAVYEPAGAIRLEILPSKPSALTAQR